jgi:hypothetical protein
MGTPLAVSTNSSWLSTGLMSLLSSRSSLAIFIALAIASAGCLSGQESSTPPPQPPADPDEDDLDIIMDLIDEVPVPPLPPVPPEVPPELPPVP